MKNNLTEVRESRGYSVDQVSYLSRVSTRSLYRLEKDDSPEPPLSSAYALATVLKCSVYDIWPDPTVLEDGTLAVMRVKGIDPPKVKKTLGPAKATKDPKTDGGKDVEGAEQ